MESVDAGLRLKFRPSEFVTTQFVTTMRMPRKRKRTRTEEGIEIARGRETRTRTRSTTKSTTRSTTRSTTKSTSKSTTRSTTKPTTKPTTMIRKEISARERLKATVGRKFLTSGPRKCPSQTMVSNDYGRRQVDRMLAVAIVHLMQVDQLPLRMMANFLVHSRM